MKPERGAGVILHHGALIGQSGGEELHQLTEEEIPSHHHEFLSDQSSGFSPGLDYSNSNCCGGIQSTTSVGGDEPHNNMQPYMALNFMMKAQAVQDIFSDLQTVVEQQQNQINQLINAQAPYSPGYQEFSYTGEPQFFVVPAGVEVLNIQCFGASGGNGEGRGGFISAQFLCQEGDSLIVMVGGKNGFNGGGESFCSNGCALNGGGATDVRLELNNIASRIIVAGGGSGSGFHGGVNQMSPYGAGGGGEVPGGNEGGTCSGAGWYVNGGGGGIYSGGENCISEYGIENASQAVLDSWCFGCDWIVLQGLSLTNGTGTLGQGGSGNFGGGGGWYGGGAGLSLFLTDPTSGGGSSYASPEYCTFPIDIHGGVNAGDGKVVFSW